MWILAAAAAAIAMPVCDGAEDCKVKWGRATQWVLDHNADIMDQSSERIVNSPTERTGQDRYQVTRIAQGGDRYVIDMRMECANVFSCKLKQTKADFVRFVSGD